MSGVDLGGLCRQLAAERSRRLVVLAGEREWSRAALPPWLLHQCGRSLALTDVPLPGIESLPAPRVFDYLGTEVDWLVFDAFAGLHPDAFGAAAGMVVGGGLLFLLAPPLHDWPGFDDPDYRRLLPAGAASVDRRFLLRLARLARDDDRVILVEQSGTPAAAFADGPPPAPHPPVAGSDEQRDAVAAVVRVATGHRRRPLVVSADRGRGKSAALGMAAAALLAREPDSRVVVTAPRLDAVETLYRFARKALAAAGAVDAIDRLLFHPPDELVRDRPAARLLLVDEAAAIPVPLLRRMVRDYARVVFSTTVHGYEGSGRGFALRFQRDLDALAPQWRRLELHAPMRWAAGDPLEAFVFRALLLDAGDADFAAPSASPASCRFQWLDRDRLAADEGLLHALYGLLVIAHYRTTPDDLRVLLDGPNVRLLAGFCDGGLAAVAMVAEEGNLPPALAVEVAAGRRRARGHLAAQLLAYRFGDAALAQQSFWRIVRIAVHPAVAGRGIGSAMLAELGAATGPETALVSSFGATAALVRFWRRNGFAMLHVGSRRDAASGAHALLVGRTADNVAAARLAAVAAADLPLLLGDTLADLEPAVVTALAGSGDGTAASAADRNLLARFAAAEVDYESAAAALWRLAAAAWATGALARLAPQPAAALVLRVLQRHSWSQSAAALGLAGRKPLLAVLRAATAELLSAYE